MLFTAGTIPGAFAVLRWREVSFAVARKQLTPAHPVHRWQVDSGPGGTRAHPVSCSIAAGSVFIACEAVQTRLRKGQELRLLQLGAFATTEPGQEHFLMEHPADQLARSSAAWPVPHSQQRHSRRAPSAGARTDCCRWAGLETLDAAGGRVLACLQRSPRSEKNIASPGSSGPAMHPLPRLLRPHRRPLRSSTPT